MQLKLLTGSFLNAIVKHYEVESRKDGLRIQIEGTQFCCGMSYILWLNELCFIQLSTPYQRFTKEKTMLLQLREANGCYV